MIKENDENAGVYIKQQTPFRGVRLNGCWGKKIEVAGKNMKKEKTA